MLAQRPLEVVVDAFALQRDATKQILGQHADLSVRGSRATDVLANDPGIGGDGQDVAGVWQTTPGLVNLFETVVVEAQVGHFPAEAVDGDAGDTQRARHLPSVLLPRFARLYMRPLRSRW